MDRLNIKTVIKSLFINMKNYFVHGNNIEPVTMEMHGMVGVVPLAFI